MSSRDTRLSTQPDGSSGSSERDPSASLGPGDKVADRYVIVRRLGAGGMGEVYEATDLELGIRVALKFPLHTSNQDAASEVRRLKQEVRAALQINHRNICRIRDLDQTSDRIFLVMEFIDGRDLSSILADLAGQDAGYDSGKLAEDLVIEIGVQLCEGLEAVHAVELTHLDIKPANIVMHKGHVVLIDFGLSNFSGFPATGERTPVYSAPEQNMDSGTTDHRTDFYAVGLVLYELLTGKLAKEHVVEQEDGVDSKRQTAWKIGPETLIHPISAILPGVHPELSETIRRCLSPLKSGRPESATELADLLRSCRSSKWVAKPGMAIPTAAAWTLETQLGTTLNGGLWLASDEAGLRRIFEFYEGDRAPSMLPDLQIQGELEASVGRQQELFWVAGHNRTQSPFYLAYAFPSGGDLESWAGPSGKHLKGLSEDHKIQLIRDLAQGIGTLHRSGYAHGRITRENIFIIAPTEGPPRAKIGRFLLPAVTGGDEDSKQAFAKDVYALGEICCQIALGRLYRRLPIDAVDGIQPEELQEDIRKALVGGAERYPDAEAMAEQLYTLEARRRERILEEKQARDRLRQRLQIGDVIQGRYVIDRMLGEGTMATVYLANDETIDKDVALKFLRRYSGMDKKFEGTAEFELGLNDFYNELRRAFEIGHENICTVRDLKYDKERGHFLVMDYIEGKSLHHTLISMKELSRFDLPVDQVKTEDKAISIGVQLALALEAVHKAGVVHRDIKPANIMVDARGKVSLLDFGVAGRLGGINDAGTPRYMAPEQIECEEAGVTADLFALGLVLYEVIAGSLPCEDSRLKRRSRQECYRDGVVPPSELTAEDVSPELERVILDCLQFDPKDRPQSATEVLTKLRALVDLRWRPEEGNELIGRPGWALREKFGTSELGELWLADHSDPEKDDLRVFEFCHRANAMERLARKYKRLDDLRKADNKGGIVRVFDNHDMFFPPYYLEYEYGNSGTLADWLRGRVEGRELTRGERLEIVGQVAEVLRRLHAESRTFGELQPAHIWLDATRSGPPQARLIALGVETTTRDQGDATLYRRSRDGGFPVRADLYGLGVLLYQMDRGDLRLSLGSPDWEKEVKSSLIRRHMQLLLRGGSSSDSDYGDTDFTRSVRILQQLEADLAEVENKEEKEDKADRFKKRSYTLSVVVLVAAIVLTVLGAFYYSLRAEKKATEEVANFLQNIFDVANPEAIEGIGAELSAAQMLEWASVKLDHGLTDRPVVRSELFHRIGLAYQGLGLYEPSMNLLLKGLELRRDTFGTRSTQVAESLNTLSRSQLSMNRVAEARANNDLALEWVREYSPLWFEVSVTRNRILRAEGKPESALEGLQGLIDVLSRKQETARLSPTVTNAEIEEELGRCLAELGKIQAARDHFEKALLIRKNLNAEAKRHGLPIDAKISGLLNDQGYLAIADNEYDAAKLSFRRSVELTQKLLGDDHPELASTLVNLGWLHHHLSEFNEAAEVFLKANEILEEALGSAHPQVLEADQSLAFLRFTMGENETAIQDYREIMKRRKAHQREDHPRYLTAQQDLGRTLIAAGNPEQARAQLVEAAQGWEREGNTNKAGRNHLYIAETYQNTENHEKAASSIKEAEAYLKANEETYPEQKGWVEEARGELARATGDPDTALGHFTDSLASFESSKNPPNRVNKSRVKLARAYLELDSPNLEEAERLTREAIKAYQGYLPNYTNHWRYAYAEVVLGRTLMLEGGERVDEGRAMIEKARDLLLDLRGASSELYQEAQGYLTS